MTWNYATALKRIGNFKKTTPTVEVSDFTQNYMPAFMARAELVRSQGKDFDEKPLFNLKPNEAILVDGVHIYANLVNFEDYLLHEDDESEIAHERALNFLHLHYSSCDRVVENYGAQRVDFHSGRMHAVVIDPIGPENVGARTAKAVIIAEQLSKLSNSFANEMRGGDYNSNYRIGIDTGMCIAINDGRGLEQEPLFLGSAANHAAKLAEGDVAGIFLSDLAQEGLARTGVSTHRNLFEKFTDDRASYQLNNESMDQVVQLGVVGSLSSDVVLRNWISEAKHEGLRKSARFEFGAHELPLSSIDYEELSPSNSIRMDMASLFADLDGYTNYIDEAMDDREKLANAVKNLHVIRGELASVLQEDFGGRKVRFIGDCVHGLTASGSNDSVDEAETVRDAILCSGGLRSSFDLCRQELSDTDSLGLAIGFELGITPITRLGIYGERSVRVASSLATVKSEGEQKRVSGDETAIGEAAFNKGSAAVRAFFGPERKISFMEYDDAVQSIPATLSAPATVKSEPEESFRAHSERR